MVEHVHPLLLFCSALFSAKLKLCCIKLSKYLIPDGMANTLFAFTTLSLCGACVVSHISCDLSILFVAFFYKIVETSPNVLQR